MVNALYVAIPVTIGCILLVGVLFYHFVCKGATDEFDQREREPLADDSKV
jgi:hypothetical protein